MLLLCLAAENAGVEGEVIVQKLLGQSFEVGYNAMYDRIENLIEVRTECWAGLHWFVGGSFIRLPGSAAGFWRVECLLTMGWSCGPCCCNGFVDCC